MPGVVLGTEDIASVPLERAVRFQEESVLEATPVPEHTLEGLPVSASEPLSSRCASRSTPGAGDAEGGSAGLRPQLSPWRKQPVQEVCQGLKE